MLRHQQMQRASRGRGIVDPVRIETKLGMVARDMGIVPLGLPNVEVIHAPR